MDQDIHAQLQSAGLIIDRPLEYGKLVRCKAEGDKGQKASGWYVLHEMRLDSGQNVVVGRYGNWKTGTGEEGLKVEFSAHISEAERARMVEVALRARVQAQEEQRQRAQAAADRAARIWQKLPEAGSSEYLQRKGVKAWGVRFSRGTVVVPVRNQQGVLAGLQFISSDGSKKFLTGTAKRGAYHFIGSPAPDGVIAVGEGYATCATVHECAKWSIAVAFDAGNLIHVARALRQLYPAASIVICADNDAGTEGNPGVTKACEAAAAVGGSVAIPDFRVSA